MKTYGNGKKVKITGGRIKHGAPKTQKVRSLTEIEREKLAQANMMIALQNAIAAILVLLLLGVAIYAILLIAL